ncbi:MAG: hypothetical protein JWQ76_436 [Ramlibacter sp.]|nr:hypothetical protein [Ramlibacter sp.]
MFQLTPSQLRAIESRREGTLVRELALRLQEHFPFRFEAGGLGDPEDFAALCVAHAVAVGLRQEAEIARYANLAVLVGIGFEDGAFAQRENLAPRPGESCDAAWLDRIVPRVEGLLRTRGNA